MLGNFGLNNNLQPTPENPIQLFIKDFDENKSPEAILTYERSGQTYTFASKDELVQRMASFRKQYPEYQTFSERTFSQIFSSDQLKNAKRKRVDRLDSYYLENNKGKGFVDYELPVEAQFSTANTLLVDDFNQDGYSDILLAGNFLEVQPNLGRQDAGLGCLLIGNGSGRFEDVAPSEINLNLFGPVRKVLPLKGANGERHILIAENKGRIKILKLSDF